MLTTLRQIVESVTAAPSLSEAMRTLVQQTRAAMHVDCCSVYISETQRQRYRLVATDGLSLDAVGKAVLPFNEGLVGLVGRREELINLADAPAHPSFKYLPEVGEDEFKTFLGVPIMHQRNVLGVLVVQQALSRQFTELDESFLVTLAAQLAVRIAHAELKGLISSSSGNHRAVHGIGVSSGMAIAKAWVWQPKMALSQVNLKHSDEPELQVELLNQAVLQVQMDLDALAMRFQDAVQVDSQSIFDIYQHILADPNFIFQIEQEITENQWNATSAVRQVSERLIEQFSAMSDPYLRERALDIRDVAQRLLSSLAHSHMEQFDFQEPVILLAEEVTATLLAEIPKDRLAGVVSMRGAVNSHAAILARTMSVPAVMGLELPLQELDGQELIIDGANGDVIIQPSGAVLAEYEQLILQAKAFDDLVAKEALLPSETQDGCPVSVLLNAGLSLDVDSCLMDCSDGVGLYRTEIPFMLHDSFPSEQEQATRYRAILEQYNGRQVCMRTLDIGGDKPLPYFPISEENPFLGWRGIRITLDHPELFLAQLKAMLRASEHNDNLAIMLPMISSVSEVQAARRLLDQAWLEVSDELRARGSAIRYPSLGAMIEVPATIYLLPDLAPYVDFWSVGTNDLTQYLLAVDRNNARVADMYDGLHPAVLRALQQIIQVANQQAKPVSVCGELAGDSIGVLILLAMGYRRFSMNLNNIAKVKYLLRRVRTDALAPLLEQAIQLSDSAQIRKIFTNYLESLGLQSFIGKKA
ncbi:phosphoenolpyruvate--protein phosphotransferase [uncultured Tolumonas sp.]|uniref:phosphoenolpyruvate--protein phosphotransferase n=1 Tax=uncultured Tolumonas sp. TaxID=263765 RepID=UPI0029304CEE|nr:phosphoenolpyruvate--protein phosphotransferase [uncultured Tolumonas sp.]